MKKILVIALSTYLAGCASSSGIVDATKVPSYFDGAHYSGKFTFVNSDTFPNQKQYRVFEQGSDSTAPLSELRAKANYSARFFCSNKRGKPRVVVVSEMTSQGPHILGNFPRYELVFTCVQQKDEPFHVMNSGEVNVDNTSNKYEQLKLLKELLDNGTLNEKEFKVEKQKLLNK
ncbi:hypothetical protein CWC14_16555 [Pseudoalteromonas sp. S3260]|uniref:hypothetical protein n=1 Tax=Pseudoalteromonas sp. S3260 TaxID=579534 RepID=UPI00110A9119|nr:hypothetical protein [Pseudoalteromonas sp. S3260]TMO94168.1 hypothetical protein CWC14_16555 [Pseudoalteromonas sp. S3260]